MTTGQSSCCVTGPTALSRWIRPSSERFDKLPVAAQRRLLQLQLIRLGLRHDYRTVELLRNRADRPVPLDPAELGTVRQTSSCSTASVVAASIDSVGVTS